MEKNNLRLKLLAAIAAVSVAAILVVVACFSLMLNSVKDDALVRGGESNSILIDFIMSGFVQTDLGKLFYAVNHAKLALEARNPADDEELLSIVTDEFYAVTIGNYSSELYMFVAREGRITAALKVEEMAYENGGAPIKTDGAVLAGIIKESGLHDDGMGYTDTWLTEMFTQKYWMYSNREVESLPMLCAAVMEEEGVAFGVYFPSVSSSFRVYEALNEISDMTREEAKDSIENMVSRYVVILASIGALLLAAIGLLSYRLSRVIANPVEREKETREQLDRMKTEFFSNVTHELKTPLTVISVHIQGAIMLFERGREGDEAKMRESFALAQDEIMRMSRLVNNALKLASRQESGWITVTPTSAMSYPPVWKHTGL